MDYKYSCVVDTGGYYKDIIKLDWMLVYLPPPLAEDGTPDYSKMETKMEWTPYCYKLVDGDRLIDTTQPTKRPHAGADGLIRPRWDDEAVAWAEGATAAEIAAWEAEHPVPPTLPPTPTEINSMAIAELSIAQAQQHNDTNQAIGELSIMIAGGMNDAV